jgi:hypothetical protein
MSQVSVITSDTLASLAMLGPSFPSHPTKKGKRIADPKWSEVINRFYSVFWLALIFTMFPSQSSTENYISHQEQESAFDDSFFCEIL